MNRRMYKVWAYWQITKWIFKMYRRVKTNLTPDFSDVPLTVLRYTRNDLRAGFKRLRLNYANDPFWMAVNREIISRKQ